MSEKTEQPTAKRLRDAREKGQIARSQEIPSAAVVLALIMYIAGRAQDIFRQISDVTLLAFSVAGDPWETGIARLVPALLDMALNILAPLVALVIVASLAANLAQIGFLFSMKAAMPKLENLSPKKWFQKVFSKKGLFELLKNLVKITVLVLVVWRVLVVNWVDLFKIPASEVRQIWSVLGGTMWDLSTHAITAFAILAVLDYFWERYQFIKQNMMSKDEVKREYK